MKNDKNIEIDCTHEMVEIERERIDFSDPNFILCKVVLRCKKCGEIEIQEIEEPKWI